MKKIYLIVILIVLLFTLKIGFASCSVEDTPVQNVVIVPIENEKHWYLEMTVAGGTLFLGALGLWLKYKKKN